MTGLKVIFEIMDNSQTLHSSGCFVGNDRPLSIAAIDILGLDTSISPADIQRNIFFTFIFICVLLYILLSYVLKNKISVQQRSTKLMWLVGNLNWNIWWQSNYIPVYLWIISITDWCVVDKPIVVASVCPTR